MARGRRRSIAGIVIPTEHEAAGSIVSNERIARILNGSIVLAASLLSFVDPRFAWLIWFMGASLIFSGVTNFCGFAVIFRRLES